MYTYFNHITILTFKGIYVTEVHDGSPASRSGLRIHDKILQVCTYL